MTLNDELCQKLGVAEGAADQTILEALDEILATRRYRYASGRRHERPSDVSPGLPPGDDRGSMLPPVCGHPTTGVVAWPSPRAATDPWGAAASTCERPACLEAATVWVYARTGKAGAYRPRATVPTATELVRGAA